MNRHLFSRFVLAVMLFCVLVSTVALADEIRYVKTNGGHLNVRTEPSTDADIITRLDYGQEVNVVWYDQDWAEISMRYEGGLLNGYVAVRYLSMSKPRALPTNSSGSGSSDTSSNVAAILNAEYRSMRPTGSFTIYARPSRAGGFVNLRWGPSTDMEVITRCYSNYELTVLAVGNNWYQVKDPQTGYIGFIMKSYTSQY